MALMLTYGARETGGQAGRMAGQYAKPRSTGWIAAGLPSYRGDMVNELTASAEGRLPIRSGCCAPTRRRPAPST